MLFEYIFLYLIIYSKMFLIWLLQMYVDFFLNKNTNSLNLFPFTFHINCIITLQIYFFILALLWLHTDSMRPPIKPLSTAN